MSRIGYGLSREKAEMIRDYKPAVDKLMTKRELIKLLEGIDDEATIGAWWDDCEWPIRGLRKGSEFDFVIECP